MGKGTIYTYTIIYSAAEDFKDKTPYVVALVEQDGKRVMARVEGYCQSMVVAIGDKVEFVSLDSAGNPIYKFLS